MIKKWAKTRWAKRKLEDAEAITKRMGDNEPRFLGVFSRERNVVAVKAGETLFKKDDPAQCSTS